MENVLRNPATGERRETNPVMTAQELEESLELSTSGFRALSALSFDDRSTRLQSAARILESEAESLAVLMAEEMGKPVREGRAEVEKCAWVCRYYAEQAERLLAPEKIETEPDQEVSVVFRPLGPVFAVMPWNFPFWQVFRFAAPALMAGNSGVLKHAANVPGCARAIEHILRESGFPEGSFVNLFLDHEQSEQVIADPRVRAITLTGSTGAGRRVAEVAGKNLKKCVLELGGSDPYLVLADADLEEAAKMCATSRLINSGQSCIAAKRFIVDARVHDRFVELLRGKFAEAVVGDPMDERTTVGPMARFDLRETLAGQVDRSVELGARCAFGGEVPRDGELGRGAYYLPTILDGVRPGMPAFDEELFGPVAAVIAVDGWEEAVAMANRSPFGLGAAVFTRDRARGEIIAADHLEAGSVAINRFVASDPRVPFGGIKDSGYGRELGSYGIREFVNAKTITKAR